MIRKIRDAHDDAQSHIHSLQTGVVHSQATTQALCKLKMPKTSK
jgi:hypothetical protein